MSKRFEVSSRTVDGIQRVTLGGAIDVASAEPLRNDLLTMLEQDLDVVVDLEGVERLDGAGLQLLIAARSLVAGKGRSLTLGTLGATAKRALETSGVSSLFPSSPAPREAQPTDCTNSMRGETP